MNIYIVGIKGVGTTALAQMYKALGHSVRGSDVPETFVTDEVLRQSGISVDESFNADHITAEIDKVVASAAFLMQDEHEEIAQARRRGIPVYSYSQALGDLAAPFEAIGVTGTHGKSTTSALLGYALQELGADPFVVVGSSVPQLGGNARAGAPHSRFFVAEVDEYRNHFLDFSPTHTILTTLDYDHPDVFPDQESYRNAFHRYLDLLPVDGTLVANISDPGIENLLAERKRDRFRLITYGKTEEADIWYDPKTGTINREDVETGTLQIALMGEHNALNATGVFTLLWYLGYESPHIFAALETFKGLKRRQEFRGRAQTGATVIDDYAHHPAEIRAVHQAIRTSYSDHNLWVVFQPHTFSRTKAMSEELVETLAQFDHILLAPVYASAREETGSYTSEHLAERLREVSDKTDIRVFEDVSSIENILQNETGHDDIIVTMGAGDINLLAEHLIQQS